jgi:hypothetical protein
MYREWLKVVKSRPEAEHQLSVELVDDPCTLPVSA